MSIGFSTRCSRRNRRAWGWASRSAALSSRPTTDDCGLPRTPGKARYSNLSCTLLQPESEYSYFPASCPPPSVPPPSGRLVHAPPARRPALVRGPSTLVSPELWLSGLGGHVV